MGPIIGLLANAGVAVGRELLGGVVNKMFNNETQAIGRGFKDYLKMQGMEKLPSNLAMYLGDEGVGDLKELDDLRRQLGIELINNPKIQSELAGLSGKEPLSLHLEKDGSFSLMTREGKAIRLEKGTGAHDLATKIHQMFSMHEMSKYAQVGSVYELANKVVENSQLQAAWSLRDDNGVMV